MADRARLLRLQRLARVRTIAQQEAARQSAEAEGTLAQLQSLVERTGNLARAYDQSAPDHDGERLKTRLGFRHGLLAIRAQALSDQHRAQVVADDLQLAMALAERRRSLVQDRAEAMARTVSRAENHLPVEAARRTGTKREE